ncbi:MAG: hypothetical protein E4H01_02605 [Lysobacterales bacterium]|nr:MAG: hypothetical protein E4H01_02605 [Xanthomonadales bacterium]
MAATAWAVYNKAKRKIGDGTIQLGTDIFKVQLHKSTSNASVATLSTAASVTNEVATGNGYTTGGQSILTRSWAVGVSAGQYKFDGADPLWTATGGAINSIMFAMIKNSAGQAVCWSKLTAIVFNLTQNNTLTIQMHVNGIFTLA